MRGVHLPSPAVGSIADRSTAQLLAYVAAAVLVVVAGIRYLDPGGGDKPAAPVAIDGEAGAATADGSDEDGRLYVHVAGEVREPGLYRLSAGARVGAAIDRAGGVEPRADLSGVNLAAELQDGQQVLVPRRGTSTAVAPAPSPSATGAPTANAGAPAAPISLAQATADELDAGVDGIGPILATRIIEFRDEQGGVGAIDELEAVDGIGEERLADLRDALVP